MAGTAGGTEPSVQWGGVSQLRDAARWRSLAATAAVANDLPTMAAACVGVRAEFEALDLEGALRTLAALAEGSHAFARLVQADHEAVLLLREAGVEVPGEVLAVFPREPAAVRATPTEDGGWCLEGHQRRSVHPGAVARVVMVASTDDGDRPFLFRMDAPGVVSDPTPLRTIAPDDPNGPVTLRGVAATPVAGADWWAARRPGFEHLLRDAACWFGACLWLCHEIEATLGTPTDTTDRLGLGRVDVWIYAARLALRGAVPDTRADPTSRSAELSARRAVATVATTADTVIRMVARQSDARASGQDPMLAGRVAQLQIALRRFDVEDNLRAVGVLVADGVRADPLVS